MVEDPTMPPGAFVQSLSHLDASGGVVLVVGPVGGPDHRTACRGLSPAVSGAPSILVSTDGFCGEPGDDRERPRPTIAYTAPRRATSASASTAGIDDDPPAVAYCSTPAELAEAVATAVERETETGGTDTDVRVCLDSLSPLLAEHSEAEVADALGRVAASVRRVAGLAHAHLPLRHDHEIVSELAPACRCVLELDRSAEGMRHRWHFDQRRASTDWYPWPDAAVGDP